jgi:hypothetical protein
VAEVEAFGEWGTTSNGSPSTDSYYQVNMITSGVGVNLSITDASNNNAGDDQFVNWNGLYNLMAEPISKTLPDDEIGNIFPNPTADYFEFNFHGAKKEQPLKVEILATTGSAQKVAPPKSRNGRYKVDISHLAAGEYFIVLSHEIHAEK